MAQDWADKTAQQILSKDLCKACLERSRKKGICLILGASDTGKTTLAEALTKHLVSSHSIGVIDADIGQSHIGPPTTVGWAVVDPIRNKTSISNGVENQDVDFSNLSAVVAYSAEEAPKAGCTKAELAAGGISFVGNITPVGHLLQLTSGIVKGVQQLTPLTGIIIIDTPGLVKGQAACALWWTVQHILKPDLILAVQKNDELSDVLTGLRFLDSRIELIQSPLEIQIKSPQQRQRYRQNQFEKYFRDSCLYNISLTNLSVQSFRRLSLPADLSVVAQAKSEALAKAGRDVLVNRLVGLRDAQGADLAIGIISDWQADKDNVVIRAPNLDIKQVRCLVVGNAAIDISDL